MFSINWKIKTQKKPAHTHTQNTAMFSPPQRERLLASWCLWVLMERTSSDLCCLEVISGRVREQEAI